MNPAHRPGRARLAALAALAGGLLLLGGAGRAAAAMPGQAARAASGRPAGVGLTLGEGAAPGAAVPAAQLPAAGHPPSAASTATSSRLTRPAFLVVGGAVLLGLVGLLGLYLTRGATRKGKP